MTVLFHGMLSGSEKMYEVFRLAKRVAAEDVPVLLRGETGTGKELIARAIHAMSPRSRAAYRAVNCAALAGELLASELFGHQKGAFTGAISSRRGLFEQADKGTLFLDEVAELPIDLQGTLLRVVQDNVITPVGGTRSKALDVRLITATHRALRRRVSEGRFRADLMYRIRVAPIFIPPLRERDGDVMRLAHHFIDRNNERGRRRRIERLSKAATTALQQYHWPGNVRELENLVDAAFALGEGPELTMADLPPELRGEAPPPDNRLPLVGGEGHKLRMVLAQCGGNRQAAADQLGISRTTLWRRMKQHGLL